MNDVTAVETPPRASGEASPLPGPTESRRRVLGVRVPTTESLFVAAVVLFGFRIGAHAIGDNSMFAHLRTGIDMARGGGIPRVDPYSFTARGHEWVAQSWFAEWTYGVLYRLWDLRLVVLEQAVLTALLAWLVVRLARAGSPIRTAAAGLLAVGAGCAFWTQRPLLFGLLCLALTVTVVVRGRSAWWLLPIGWLWVNTHGSFPLGGLWIGAFFVGTWIDRRSFPRDLVRYVVLFFAGLLVGGVVSPLGPKLLTFALTVGDKREVFKTIVEWRSPDFQATPGLFTLPFAGLGALVLARSRLSWREALPVAGFALLGLVAERNLAAAAIVAAPVLGRCLAAPLPGRTPGDRRDRRPVNLAFLGLILFAGLLFTGSVTGAAALNEKAYPVEATRWMSRAGLLSGSHRVAHQDVVGDWLILRHPKAPPVFVDDRYDMYPAKVSDDYTTLLHAEPGALSVLDRYDIDVVLWDRATPLVELLRATDDWRQVHRSGDWIVLVRR